ncbi:MAG: hypothetical protein MJZ37_01215 [Bacilli bacterium]|nr:hypothetical protein [Bacilli bacterium]
MSKTNNTLIDEENVIDVSETVESTVKETEVTTEIEKEPVKAESKVSKVGGKVAAMSAETQRMNARQFFDTYPHDNKQVVNLIITLYGNQIKTVAQWEAFYQQMLKKKVS